MLAHHPPTTNERINYFSHYSYHSSPFKKTLQSEPSIWPCQRPLTRLPIFHEAALVEAPVRPCHRAHAVHLAGGGFFGHSIYVNI